MIDLNTPIWKLTVGELIEVVNHITPKPEIMKEERKLVYGIDGIAELFGCSKSTAQRIKNSGKIKKAITQVGRKIVVDADKALKLYRGH